MSGFSIVRTFVAGFGFLTLVGTSLPAEAQSNRPSRLHKYAEPGKQDVGEVMQQYARCVAGENHGRELLDTRPTSQAEVDLANSRPPRNDRCLNDGPLRVWNREVSYSLAALRGRVARIYVVELHGGEAVASPNGAISSLSNRVAGTSKYDRSTLVSHQFAACLADERHAASRAYVVAEEASPEEDAAFVELSEYFSDCFVEGATLSLTKTSLKHTLAEAVYHNLTFNSGAAL